MLISALLEKHRKYHKCRMQPTPVEMNRLRAFETSFMQCRWDEAVVEAEIQKLAGEFQQKVADHCLELWEELRKEINWGSLRSTGSRSLLHT